MCIRDKLNIEWSKNSDRIADYEKEKVERDQKMQKQDNKIKGKKDLGGGNYAMGESDKNMGDMDDHKGNAALLRDKPKEVVLMILLQQAIKDKCNPVMLSTTDQRYEKPIAVFPHCENQMVDIAMNEAASLSMMSHCLLYTSPSPRDLSTSRMPSSA
eukprot:TRINITY_DN5960_c0_g1_i1.p1 TRINITY_DN5960_c0_g1~~TRINITY_DN5960_c0_g1_i1.p1  ORF type:complete len:169 (-),score=77.38 TRINITY_DN5960_c0_g1_i1:7-477(-)